jgi:hypothetical protein
MLANTTEHVLQVWETSVGVIPLQGALRLLTALGVDNAPSLSIGAIEALLLRLRGQLFGAALDLTADCPACGSRLEWQLGVDDLLIPESTETGLLEIEADGYAVTLRVLSGAEAIAAARTLEPHNALAVLLESCVVRAVRDGELVASRDLPEWVREAVAARLSKADPQADISFDLRCPSCAHTWTAAFDVAAFLTRELDTWARRTLSEVHTLASRYGWSEADILAMSPQRRHWYLEMALQ